MRRIAAKGEWCPHQSGFTLVEVIIAMVIVGILITTALQWGKPITDTVRTEETKAEMNALANAIAGNPEVQNNGVRSDFGYVGDVGAMPVNLDGLVTNPGSYTTWKGPYVASRFTQMTNDYKQDAWGVTYTYDAANCQLTSTGSGSSIVRQLGASRNALLYNSFAGSVKDLDGSPPGPSNKDSITIRLTIPNGSGGTVVKTTKPDASGYFTFDSIPIGNQDIQVIYTHTADTLNRFVSIMPSVAGYANYYLTSDVFHPAVGGGGSGIIFVTNSDTVPANGGGEYDCNDLRFWVKNNSGSSKTITSMSLTWGAPTAYYAKIYWNNTLVFNLNGSPRGVSGTVYTFSASQTLTAGQSVQIRVEDFRQSNTSAGGSTRSMSAVQATVLFSDGSTFTEAFPVCGD